MVKYTVILINMVGLLVYHLFIGGDISVSTSLPDTMKFNTDTPLELTINKGSVSSFAKLSLELPDGFIASATPQELKGASITQSGNNVKVIWTSLPSDAKFKVVIKLKATTGTTEGAKTITGKFAYVLDNVKQTADVPSVSTNVKDVPPVVASKTEPEKTEPEKTETPANTTPTEPEKTEPAKTEPAVVNNNTPTNSNPTNAPPDKTETQPALTNTNTENTTAGTPAKTTAQNNLPAALTGVGAVRSMPTEAAGEFVVNITINKSGLAGFAKLQETLPPGFTASALETNGATFTFVDQVAKFVWVSLPSQPELKISYKVQPGKNVGEKSFEGLFSYIENDETKKSPIASTSINIKPAADQVATISTPPNKNPDNVNTNPANTNNTNPDQANTNTASNTNATTPVSDPVSRIPLAQNGINYRVQIMALHRNIDVAYFQTAYKISEKVVTDLNEGWTKYMVGSFNEYKSTRDHREEVRAKGVVGPFVTAYNSGKRITVQEALMITNQKWYK